MPEVSDSVLAGRSVFLSRARLQCRELCLQLETRGARPILCPMLRFALSSDTSELDSALRNLSQFDWWLVTSQNAVDFAVTRGAQLGVRVGESAASVRVAAVGPGTANAAARAGVRVDYVAREHVAVQLAAELSDELRGKKVLLLRSDLADAALPAKLKETGALVTDLVAYRTLPPAPEDLAQLRTISWPSVAAALFFSPSAVRNFAECVGLPVLKRDCEHLLFVAIGPVTMDAIRELEVRRTAQAADASIPAILRALEEALEKAGAHSKTGAQPR